MTFSNTQMCRLSLKWLFNVISTHILQLLMIAKLILNRPCSFDFMWSMDTCGSSSSISSDDARKVNKSPRVPSAVLVKQKLPNFRIPLPSSRIWRKWNKMGFICVFKSSLTYAIVHSLSDLGWVQVRHNDPWFMDVFESLDQIPSKPPHRPFWTSVIMFN